MQKLAEEAKPEIKKISPRLASFRKEEFQIIKTDKSEFMKPYPKLYAKKGKITAPFSSVISEEEKTKKPLDPHEIVGVFSGELRSSELTAFSSGTSSPSPWSRKKFLSMKSFSRNFSSMNTTKLTLEQQNKNLMNFCFERSAKILEFKLVDIVVTNSEHSVNKAINSAFLVNGLVEIFPSNLESSFAVVLSLDVENVLNFVISL